jgi:hypothetical protein
VECSTFSSARSTLPQVAIRRTWRSPISKGFCLGKRRCGDCRLVRAAGAFPDIFCSADTSSHRGTLAVFEPRPNRRATRCRSPAPAKGLSLSPGWDPNLGGIFARNLAASDCPSSLFVGRRSARRSSSRPTCPAVPVSRGAGGVSALCR